MGAVKLDHSDPAQHRASIMQQLRQFWMDDHLCDVVLKSHDGAEHRAHTAVLSAASVFFQESAGWVVSGSREGATEAASGNRCVQSGSVCLAGLHLWWAASKYQWKLVLNSYDWQRLMTCQS